MAVLQGAALEEPSWTTPSTADACQAESQGKRTRVAQVLKGPIVPLGMQRPSRLVDRPVKMAVAVVVDPGTSEAEPEHRNTLTWEAAVAAALLTWPRII